MEILNILQISTQFSLQWIVASLITVAGSMAVQKYINLENKRKIENIEQENRSNSLKIADLEKRMAVNDYSYKHMYESLTELKIQNNKILDALNNIKISCAGKDVKC